MENMASSSTGKRKLPLTLLFLLPLLLEFGLGTFFWSEVLPLYPFDHIIFGIVWLLAALFTIPFLVLKKGRWELLVLFVLLLGIELLAASAALWGPDYGSNDIWSNLSTEWHGAVHYEPRWTDWCAHSEECSNFGQDPLPFGTSTLWCPVPLITFLLLFLDLVFLPIELYWRRKKERIAADCA